MENNRVDKLEEKIDKLDERLDKIDKHLAVYNSELKIHIEGTIQNRDAIKVMSKRLSPIEKHIDIVKALFKTFLYFCSVVAFLVGVYISLNK